jgi:hypothetical protein
MKTLIHVLRWPALGLAACSPALAWLGLCLAPDVLGQVDEYRQAQAALSQVGRDSADLERRRARLAAWLEAKNRICRELIDGRCTLADAARRVDLLPDQPHDFRKALAEVELGTTDGERLCRHLIDWACGLLWDDPSAAAQLRQRLEAELEMGSGQ